MFLTDYLREVAADFRRLRHQNHRLYAGILAIVALLAWIISWQVITFLASLCSNAGLSINGMVTHNGTLLEHGRISFHREDANLDQMPLADAVIVAGRYEVPPSPALKPGRYVARIWSPRAVPHDGITTPPAEEQIPPEFNDKSSLVIELRWFGWNVFNFVLHEHQRGATVPTRRGNRRRMFGAGGRKPLAAARRRHSKSRPRAPTPKRCGRGGARPYYR